MESCWDTPFEESMLDLPQEVVIACPNRDLAKDLFEIFSENDVGKNWDPTEFADTRWSHYGEETAYFMRNGRLLYGTRSGAERGGFSNYVKCTFFGDAGADFEIADDGELRVLLGIGGG